MTEANQPHRVSILERIDGAKLLRLGSMVAATLSEVEDVEQDEMGCRHLQEAHQRTVKELSELMPPRAA